MLSHYCFRFVGCRVTLRAHWKYFEIGHIWFNTWFQFKRPPYLKKTPRPNNLHMNLQDTWHTKMSFWPLCWCWTSNYFLKESVRNFKPKEPAYLVSRKCSITYQITQAAWFFTTEGDKWRVSKMKASLAVLSKARCC